MTSEIWGFISALKIFLTKEQIDKIFDDRNNRRNTGIINN